MGKELAVDRDGNLTWCSVAPENRGTKGCTHVGHKESGESQEEFLKRISETPVEPELPKNFKSDDLEERVYASTVLQIWREDPDYVSRVYEVYYGERVKDEADLTEKLNRELQDKTIVSSVFPKDTSKRALDSNQIADLIWKKRINKSDPKRSLQAKTVSRWYRNNPQIWDEDPKQAVQDLASRGYVNVEIPAREYAGLLRKHKVSLDEVKLEDYDRKAVTKELKKLDWEESNKDKVFKTWDDAAKMSPSPRDKEYEGWLGKLTEGMLHEEEAYLKRSSASGRSSGYDEQTERCAIGLRKLREERQRRWS